LIDAKEVTDFLTTVSKGVVKIDIANDNFVGFGARRGGEGNEGPVWEVPPPPKVDGGPIPVLRDEFSVSEIDSRKIIVVTVSGEEG
jgi:hypothetical protein